jgi:hypothetical protein
MPLFYELLSEVLRIARLRAEEDDAILACLFHPLDNASSVAAIQAILAILDDG